MSNQDDSTLPIRVAKIETEMASLISGMTAVEASIERLSGKINDMRAPNWMLMGMVIGIGGGLWALAIRPIEDSLSEVRGDIAVLNQRSQASEQDRRALLVQFGEIETQFKNAGDISNMREQTAHMIRQLLWRRVYGEELPSWDYWTDFHKRGSSGQ